MFGATLAGFGWRRSRYSTMRFVRVPPRPWWWRLRHPFAPPRPPPLPADFQPPPLPPWFGPPESELGEATHLREVLAADEGVAIALVSCVAFSTGFEFGIAVRAKEQIDPHEIGFGPPPPHGPRPSGRELVIGLEYADGRNATVNNHPGGQVMAFYANAGEGREPELPVGPILMPRGGGGGGRRWDFHYWVWPLPPEGRLTFTCEWPARGMVLTAHDVDATEIRRAGNSSVKLWDAGNEQL
jgi:hypothetical protein